MIKEFFVNNTPGPEFKIFGPTHLLCITFVLICLLLIYLNRNNIFKLKAKTKRKILIIGALLMLANMVIYNISTIYYGIFDYRIHLPFHLCFISGYMFMYGIIFKKEEILKYTFFLAFIGPIPAILWPDLPSSFDYFKFYEYFISHHLFLILSFFSYYALNYNINLRNVIKVAILTNILIFIMMPFNIIFNMNYIYSSEIPAYIVKIYPILRYIKPLIVLEAVGILIVALIYQLVRIRNKEIIKTI